MSRLPLSLPARVAILATVVGSIACGPGPQTAREAIDPFLRAVQAGDTDALYCLLAGAATPDGPTDDEAARQARFEAWAASRFEAYRAGRDEGWVEPDEAGVALVKLLALGKGTYFDLAEARRIAPNAMAVRMDLRFGYDAIQLNRLSPGTTFYVCGSPVGRVHPIRVPVSGEETAEVLVTLSLAWTLVRRDEPEGTCAPGWTVAGIRPLEETAVSTSLTWVF